MDTFRPNPRHAGQGDVMEREVGKVKQKRGKAPKLAVVNSGNVVPILRGKGKGAEGLTAKQEAFAVKVSEGNTLADSYRHSYSAENMAQTSIHVEACKLMANPLIALRVNALIEAKRVKSSHDAARIKASVIERLQIEANDTKNPASVRVRALELLGKMTDVSLFVEKIETTAKESRTPEEIHEEIKQKLSKLAG